MSGDWPERSRRAGGRFSFPVFDAGQRCGTRSEYQEHPIANTFVILCTSPALAAALSLVSLGKVTKRTTWIAIVSVMVGLAIVVSGSLRSENIIGDALAFFAVTYRIIPDYLAVPETARMNHFVLSLVAVFVVSLLLAGVLGVSTFEALAESAPDWVCRQHAENGH